MLRFSATRLFQKSANVRGKGKGTSEEPSVVYGLFNDISWHPLGPMNGLTIK